MSHWRRTLGYLPLILLAALLLRAGFAWAYIHPRPERALSTIPFLFEPGNIAYSLVNGKGFSSPFRIETGPTAWMSPVYPLLLALIFKLCGTYTFHAFIAAVSLNILFSTCTCIPVYAVAKRIAGGNAAAAAAWLWAVFPNTILNCYESLWDATLAGLLAATILWATLAVADSRCTKHWLFYGLLWGFTAMTNPSLISLLPILLAWMIYRQRSMLGAATRNACLAVAVAVLCCVPWTIRNYRVLHAFIPFRTPVGLILWLGNNAEIQGRWPGLLHPISNQSERIKYIQQGELAYMAEKEHLALSYFFSHPAEDARMTANRFIATWTGGTAHPIDDLRNVPSMRFRVVLIFNVLTALAAALAIVVLAVRRNAFVLPVSVFPLVFPCVYYLTVTTPRYRLVIDPTVMVLAALGLQSMALQFTGSPGNKAQRSKAPPRYTKRSPHKRSKPGGSPATRSTPAAT